MTALNVNLIPLAKDIQDFSFQSRATARLYSKLFTPQVVSTSYGDYQFPKGYYGELLRGGTGVGKTYILLSLIRQLVSENKLLQIEGSLCPFKVLWIMPSNAKIQIARAIKMYGLTQYIHCMSYRELSKKEQMYVAWSSKIKGEIVLEPYWNPLMLPPLVIFDECQYLRNANTLQTRVALALPTHTMDVKVILASATPLQRLVEARVFMVLCGVITPYNSFPLTQSLFKEVADSLCARGRNIDNYSPKNIKNLKDSCEEWWTEVSGVKFKHKATTNLIEIPFSNEEQKFEYSRAYKEYQDYIYKLKQDRGYFDTGWIIEQWVALKKFMQKAELLISPELAAHAKSKCDNGRQVIVGSEFVASLRAVWTILTQLYGVDPKRIGFIVGGQNMLERQRMVDCWQAGKLDYMLIMKKAGGVAISLHHDREKSRPRSVVLGPTYEAVNLVQFLGRGHRLTSISDTEQDVLWLSPTVMSEKVLPKVASKLTCLDAAVTAKEQWGSMLMELASGDVQDEASEIIAEQEASGEVEDLDAENTEETGEGLSNDTDERHERKMEESKNYE